MRKKGVKWENRHHTHRGKKNDLQNINVVLSNHKELWANISKYCVYEKKCLEVVASNNSCLNVVSDLWKRNLECHKWLQTELTEFQLHKNASFNCHYQCSVCQNKRYWKFTREKYNEISRHDSNESLWQRHVKEKHGSVNRMILYLSKLNDVCNIVT